ncbi:LysR family transcriptional regulator [Vagococcus fluvialis]|uniref:LysR family transcriptional regulator n=1 Tax=Vagococcus fluvialis TaxID=2738 RepID=UPI001432E4BC|nr:LysR family transcriptional regulator [Vagococcus fluvialis]MBO0488095.1 LysR family transcriptional regulator [Vagococcus fluvialis]NKC59931.1 LysR family transcriptional regulator [Vagococcus fluvialis]NKD50812.1 LysR family transcriptional regulator [Vagococcus fluvialis]
MLDYRYNTFIVLVETKSYTKTAKQINFTQPAVTKHIQFIEKELKTSLVIYQNNQLTITSEGIYLYHQIKKIQSEINKIESFLIDEISLQIGTSKTIGEFIISDTLSEFNQQFDNPKVSVLVDNTSALLSLLTKRKIDFALISGPTSISDFDCEVFLEDNILLVCSNQHPLANRTVSINKLSTERFLIRESGSGIMEAVLNKFNEHKMDYQDLSNKQVVGNINVIKDMVYKNEGISFIYQSSVKKELENKKLSTITIKGFNQKQPFYIVKNQQQILNNSSYSFLKLLKNKKEC